MSTPLRPQRRGRKIALTPAELDAYLADERTCRVATIGTDGAPHVAPLWFAWDSGFVWLYSLTRSQRWKDVLADPRVSIVVDSGHDYNELIGVEITGTARTVGQTPRLGGADAELAGVERLFARKYMASDELYHDGRHAWLRVTPSKIASWDFRKIASPA
jgi:PPOX class probable F420-dependent enzyme